MFKISDVIKVLKALENQHERVYVKDINIEKDGLENETIGYTMEIMMYDMETGVNYGASVHR